MPPQRDSSFQHPSQNAQPVDCPSSLIDTIVLSQPSDIEPHTVNQALTDPKWRQAMNDEFDALVRNGTWEFVPSISKQNFVGCK